MRHITADQMWPPPEDWVEVVVLWDDILKTDTRLPIATMLDWLNSAPGGDYHIHGYNSTEGFSFRFRNPADATHFRLRWL
jgi:hypothetical protein